MADTQSDLGLDSVSSPGFDCSSGRNFVRVDMSVCCETGISMRIGSWGTGYGTLVEDCWTEVGLARPVQKVSAAPMVQPSLN